MVVTNVTVCVRNVERLISRCEDIIGERLAIKGQKWRLPKYVETLNEMITQLDTKHGSSVDIDQLRSFKQRVSIIQEVLRQHRVKNMKPEDVSSSSIGTPNTNHQRSLDGADVHGSGLLRRTLTRNYQEMRQELFHREDESPSHLTSRSLTAQTTKEEGASVETILAKHQDMQEKIAEDMMLIARSLKDHSMAARDIIKADTKVLNKASEIADRNIQEIDKQTNRLKEKNRQCQWGVWVLLVIVGVVFLQMVIFIRVFPKL